MKRATKIKQKKGRQISHKQLAYKYKLLTYLMDHIPDVIYFKDRGGKLILVNQAHAEGFGLKPRDIVGKTDFDLFPKKIAEMMARDDMYVFETGNSIIDKIERATDPDGLDNYVSTTKIPKYGDKGKIIGLIGITRDVTKRMQFERLKERNIHIEKRLEALEELNKIKSDFISAVSHELRTPLAIIKQLVTLLFDENAGPINSKQKEMLKRTRDNIERLKHIIDELLDISRIESGRFKLHYSLINLNDLITNSSDFFKKSAQEKGIVLNYYLPKKQVNLFIDADRVNQVISNLIDNAIKFTGQSGEIEVDVKVFETKVRISVKDTGIGIARSNLPLLFKKFIQVSKIASAEKKGIGLGLSIAKEWIERHGGEIWVESKLGAGSKFYFTLPRIYTLEILDDQIKEKVNDLLERGVSLCIIELLIVNYTEFKKRIKIGSKKLFNDLEVIIKETFREIGLSRREKPQIALTDIKNGKCSIIFPEATERKAATITKLLKEKVKRYFRKSKIENVFITLGILSYPRKGRHYGIKQFPVDIHIKKIRLGSEKRGFKRVLYKADINLVPPEDETKPAESVDISKGGICFISEKLLETDSEVKIKMSLPRAKKTISAKVRVAWIKKMQRAPGELLDRYKVGTEFVSLKDKDRKILSGEFKL